MAAIELQAIAHNYTGKKDEQVLFNIEKTFEMGKAYALLGPSGCGKTTLLNILSGLLEPTEGSVFIGDRDVTRLPPQARNIAQVFQFPIIYESMSVYNNLAFPLRNRGYSSKDIRKTVEHIAEILDLTPSLYKKAGTLGIEKKQITALGRGLVREDVHAILLDEALTAIDPYEKWVFRRKLKEIHRQYNHVMIYVTHDQSEALTFADQILVMDKGRILQMDSPDRLFETPQTKFVGYFIGSPGMNFLPLTLGSSKELVLAKQVLAKLPAKGAGYASVQSWELGIRPEYVEILPKVPAKRKTQSAITFPAKVENVTSLGSIRLVYTRMGEHEVVARMSAAQTLSETVYLKFPIEKMHFFADEQRVDLTAAK